jgi:ankyrin repeat protein
MASKMDPKEYSIALSLVAVSDNPKLVRTLLDKGADANVVDPTGRTALMYAAVSDELPVEQIKMLLDKGANVNAQLKKQQPYRAKLDRGNDTMLTTGTTPLLRAAKAADIPAMRLLLAKGADPKLATRAGITPLMAAAGMSGSARGGLGSAIVGGAKQQDVQPRVLKTIDLLLDGGANINARVTDSRTHTAKMVAYITGRDHEGQTGGEGGSAQHRTTSGRMASMKRRAGRGVNRIRHSRPARRRRRPRARSCRSPGRSARS